MNLFNSKSVCGFSEVHVVLMSKMVDVLTREKANKVAGRDRIVKVLTCCVFDPYQGHLKVASSS